MNHPLQSTDYLHYRKGQPLTCLQQWREQGGEGLLVVDFQLQQYWLPDAPALPLSAIYLWSQQRLSVSVTDQQLVDPGGLDAAALYDYWSERCGFGCFVPGQPMNLQPVYIAKPWGQEIWYTGVEERGVCAFADAGKATAIPWLQAVMPDAAAGPADQALVLLKILDPSPEPVIGDLYFELHEEKREVYVVTEVDKSAWPDGVGAIRYGFDPQYRRQFDSDAQFKAAYVKAVKDYERVRRQLDALPAAEAAPETLQQAERTKRQAMNRFTYLRPLRVGDVVKVPLRLPHSLQHGVRTIEFQTPVYERKILSFAQQVLTQDHWDTDQAAAIMDLEPPAEEAFECLQKGPGLIVERIVDFDDFEVRRITLEAAATIEDLAVPDYGVAMVVAGQAELNAAQYPAGSALFMPGQRAFYRLSCAAKEPLVFLLALPR